MSETGTFSADRLEFEKADPHENSAIGLIHIPVALLSAFLGFGITYLSLRTPQVNFLVGDSRVAASTNPTVSPENLKEAGKKLYSVHCTACHQPTGRGLANVFPPLDGSSWVTGPPQTTSAIVLHGIEGELQVNGARFDGVMPTFKDRLSHAEIASIVTYIRTSWGNQAEPVTTETVAAAYEKTKQRTGPWAGGAELEKIKWDEPR